MLGGNSRSQATLVEMAHDSDKRARTSQQNSKSQSSNGHILNHENSQKSDNDEQIIVSKEGVGIHTGRLARVEVKESHENGIHFSFTEDNTRFSCPAQWDRLSGTTRSTALVMRGDSRKKVQVSMIEHFMSMAHIWNLDKVDVQLSILNYAKSNASSAEIEHVEVPVLDGSSLEWCTSIKARSLVPQERAVWVIAKTFEHRDGDRLIRFEAAQPNEAHKTQYFFQGNFGPEIYQENSFSMNWIDPTDSQLAYLKNIAPARTIGFLHEIEALRARGLALGGSLDNALVIDGSKILNPGGERIKNELAAHKLLDAVGDFALAGRPILGNIMLKSAGHALHLRSLQLAFEEGCLQAGYLKPDGRILASSAL